MYHRMPFILSMAVSLVLLFTFNVSSGSLEPPDQPGSTMKTLDQVQPCTPVQSLAGDASATHIITGSGSYYLSANITGESGKHGILVQADNVTIDLKGFSLIGGAGSLDGIHFEEGTIAGMVVNGMLRGWGEDGLDGETLTAGRFEDMTCEGNGGTGIQLGIDSLASGCLLRENGGYGVNGNDNCMVHNCIARENSVGGFRLYSGGVIDGCVAERTGPAGILVQYESTVQNCLSSFNGSGIEINEGNSVKNNNCVSNYDSGIQCSGKRNSIDSNSIATRSSGTGIKMLETSGSNILLRNTVVIEGSAVAYDIPSGSGTAYGPIVDVTGAGDISSVSNATSHPWANFVY